MKPKLEKDRLLLFVNVEEYSSLLNLMAPTNIISNQDMQVQGVENLILDYPNNRCIAVLDFNKSNDPTPT